MSRVVDDLALLLVGGDRARMDEGRSLVADMLRPALQVLAESAPLIRELHRLALRQQRRLVHAQYRAKRRHR